MIANSTRVGNITVSSLEANVARFRKEVKVFKDNHKISYSDRDIGYHDGDLGKSESLGMQGGGRNTGRFGTGTYFVGKM